MGSHRLLTGVREPLTCTRCKKNCGGHVEQEEILIFCRSFYIIASVIVMYRMSLKCCPKCKKVFIVEPYQKICGECKEQRRIKQYLRTHKQLAPFEDYTKPLLKIQCIICETETPLRKSHCRLYCRKCGALIYDPAIDKVLV